MTKSIMKKDRQSSVLLVDDSPETRELVRQYLHLSKRLTLIGTAADGEEALEKIHQLQPDVVLLDVLLPRLDGLEVLRRLQENPPAKFPVVIMTTVVGEGWVSRYAFRLGASFYMIKPFEMAVLEQHILEILAQDVGRVGVPAITARAVMAMGIPPKVLGFRYIVQAVEPLLQSEERPILKEVYQSIADGANTSPECVEKAIRVAIAQATTKKTPSFQALMRGALLEKRPTNKQFLTLVAEQVKIEMGQHP